MEQHAFMKEERERYKYSTACDTAAISLVVKGNVARVLKTQKQTLPSFLILIQRSIV